MSAVLVLNADYSILEIVSWQKAMSMIVREKARLVEGYANRFIRSATQVFAFPAVVVRTQYVRARKKVRLSRRNILARDGYTCAYCGARPRRESGAPRLESLTIDHVVPRAHAERGWVTLPWSRERARVTSWENVLTACEGCNTRKANRTPDQAGLCLARVPRAPTPQDIAWMTLFAVEIPEEWKAYLPEGSPWADYWDVELADAE